MTAFEYWPEIEFGLRALGVAALVFWLLVLADARRWWPLRWSLHLDAAARNLSPGQAGEVCVVVPARNEAPMLPRTLPRLLRQADWFRRLVIVDDRSADATASAARRLAVGSPAEGKLRVVRRSAEAEDGVGKVAALSAGVREATHDWAGDPRRQWLLFTDADVLHPASSIRRLLAKADADGYDMVSVMVKLRSHYFWEWLLIPPFLYFFHLLYPFRKVSDPRCRRAAAAGGCILVRRAALEEAGGLEPLRDRLIDDVALARNLKRAGARLWLGLDPDMSSLRPYSSFAAVREMVARSAFEQLGYHLALVPVVWLALAVCFVLPPLLALTGGVLLDPWIATPAALAYFAGALHLLPVVQYLDAPAAFAATLPVAALAYGWFTTLSAWRHLRGLPTPWREPSEGREPDSD